MKRLLPALLVMGIAPLLLAPVRLRDSTPSFFTPLGQSPAPESYSLPAAEPLITPTVIFVSPTLQTPEPSPTEAAPQAVTPTTSLNLPLSPTPTTPPPAPKPVTPQQAEYNTMDPTSAALCQRGLILVQDLASLSYREQQKPAVLKLSLAATMAMPEVAALQWPNLAAYNAAVGDMPWFYPHKAEIRDAAAATTALCRRPY